MKEEKLLEVKKAIHKIGNTIAIYLNEEKKEIQLRMMDDEKHSLRGFLIRKEGKQIQIGELLDHMIPKILNVIFEYKNGRVSNYRVGKVTHEKFGNYVIVKESKKYITFRFYGKREWRAFKERTADDTFKLNYQALLRAEKQCKEILTSIFTTNIDDYNHAKDLISKCVEYINIL